MKNCLRSVAAALALCIAFGPGIARADTVTDLVNYYSFDNSTDPGHDDSGNLRDAAFVGAGRAVPDGLSCSYGVISAGTKEDPRSRGSNQ